MKATYKILLAAGLLFGLSACDSGGGGGDNDTDASYIQFYNASPDSSSATMKLDAREFSNVSYGDATNVYPITPDKYDVTIEGKDADGNDVELISEEDVDLKRDDRHLFALAGPFAEPQLIDFKYEILDLDDDQENGGYMQLHFGHLADNVDQFDIYYGKSDVDFAEATMVDGGLTFGNFTEGTILETSDYIVYLTEPGGSEVLFQTPNISLNSETIYFLVLRQGFGPGEPKVVLDRITNSSTVLGYADKNAAAEYRVFNGISESETISIQATSVDGDYPIESIAPDTFSEFVEVPFSDYRVTATDQDSNVILNNLLLTLNQSQSVSVVIYQDADGVGKGITYEQDPRPRTNEHEVNIINVSKDQDDVDFYFIAPDETTATARYVLEGVDLEEIKTVNLPSGTYKIIALREDSNDVPIILFESESVTTEAGINYSLILVKDASQELGYDLTFLR